MDLGHRSNKGKAHYMEVIPDIEHEEEITQDADNPGGCGEDIDGFG